MKSKVIDVFEIKGRSALEYGAQGLVVVVENRTNAPGVGESVLMVRPDGWMIRRVVADSRAYGGAPAGFFLPGLRKEDVPLDAIVRWGTDVWNRLTEDLPLDAAREPAHIGAGD